MTDVPGKCQGQDLVVFERSDSRVAAQALDGTGPQIRSSSHHGDDRVARLMVNTGILGGQVRLRIGLRLYDLYVI